MDPACVLAVNAGSSSIRFALYDVTEPLLRRLRGKIECIGLPGTALTVDDSTGARAQSRPIDARAHSGAASALIDWHEKGIRRFGFHGVSYAFLMEELERVAGTDASRGRAILAH